MVQSRCRAGLAEEPIASRRVGRSGLIVVEHFDRDVTFEVVVHGAMDACDSPRTDDLAELVTIGEEARHGVVGQRAAGAERMSLGERTSSSRLATPERMIVSATA